MSVNRFNFREAGSCLIDLNSAFRNGVSGAGSFTSLPKGAAHWIGASSVAAGILGVPVGLSIAKDGYHRAKTAVKRGDGEGVVHHGSWCAVGTGYAGLSGLLGTNGVYSLLSKKTPCFIAPAFTYGGLAMYGALLVHAAYGLWRASAFEGKLKQLQRGDALLWLNDQIHLTPSDLEKWKDPGEREEFLKRKRDRFALQTNPDCLARVVEKLPLLIDRFDPVEAGQLIEEVLKASFKQRVKYVLFLILALLGIGASVCLFFASGAASPFLFGVSAIGWFALDCSQLHSYLGEKFWNWIGREKEGEIQNQEANKKFLPFQAD